MLGIIPASAVHFHNPVLAYENGDEFHGFLSPGRGRATRPVHSRRRGLDPEREEQAGRLLGGIGDRPTTGQPITDLRMDRPPGAATPGPWWPPAPVRPTAAFTRWRAIRPAAWAWPDYLGWQWKSKAGVPIVCVPGCPVQPDNFMETLLYLLHQAAGSAPMIPLDEKLRPTWLFGHTVHEGCDRGGYYEQADSPTSTAAEQCIVKLGCWGPVVQCNVGQTRLDGRHRRLSERRRRVHRLHDARLSRQIHALHGRAARRQLSTRAVEIYGKTVRALRG